MADFKLIGSVLPNAASNTSLTSVFAIPGDFSHYAVEVIPSMMITATGQAQILGARTSDGTFREIVYSNNPATATSGNQFAGEISTSSTASGAFVINEALQFAKFVKVKFTNTITANTAVYFYGRKFD